MPGRQLRGRRPGPVRTLPVLVTDLLELAHTPAAGIRLWHTSADQWRGTNDGSRGGGQMAGKGASSPIRHAVSHRLQGAEAAIRRNRRLEVYPSSETTINIIPPALLYVVARIVPAHPHLVAPSSERFRDKFCRSGRGGNQEGAGSGSMPEIRLGQQRKHGLDSSRPFTRIQFR